MAHRVASTYDTQGLLYVVTGDRIQAWCAQHHTGAVKTHLRLIAA